MMHLPPQFPVDENNLSNFSSWESRNEQNSKDTKFIIATIFKSFLPSYSWWKKTNVPLKQFRKYKVWPLKLVALKTRAKCTILVLHRYVQVRLRASDTYYYVHLTRHFHELSLNIATYIWLKLKCIVRRRLTHFAVCNTLYAEIPVFVLGQVTSDNHLLWY